MKYSQGNIINVVVRELIANRIRKGMHVRWLLIVESILLVETGTTSTKQYGIPEGSVRR
jgi:hypothetical protein